MAVPSGKENWRPDDEALSFADIAYHLIQADLWMFEKINNPSLEAIVGEAGQALVETRDQYENLLERLEKLGRERANFIINLGEAKLDEMIYDERFGGEISIWWMIMRGNIDHEIHHRGQLSAYLRFISEHQDTA